MKSSAHSQPVVKLPTTTKYNVLSSVTRAVQRKEAEPPIALAVPRQAASMPSAPG
jgi:hypothetical protein